MPTTYRVVLETETRPRETAVALDHLPAFQVDAPNVDIAARLAMSHHIDSRPTVSASRRDLVRAPRDHAAAPRPERASPRPRRRGRDLPPQRRVLPHRTPRALTARLRPEQAPRRQANRVNRPSGRHAFDHDARTTDRRPLPRATVPRGDCRHVPRPPPAHRLPRRHEPPCHDSPYDPMSADGRRHRQTTVRGPAPPPRAGGSFGPPSRPC